MLEKRVPLLSSRGPCSLLLLLLVLELVRGGSLSLTQARARFVVATCAAAGGDWRESQNERECGGDFARSALRSHRPRLT